jgi:uncharacterized surface protein with fasciclin (FAS1) repeats
MRKLLVLIVSLWLGLAFAQQDNPDVTALQGLSEDDDFTVLISLLTQAGLTEALGEVGEFTLFAPENDAFEDLDESILMRLEADPELLEQVLLGHVVQGRYGVNDLQDAEEGSVMSLQGEALDLNLGLGGFMVNGAGIDSTDTGISYSDGIVHAMDSVILPMSLKAQLENAD